MLVFNTLYGAGKLAATMPEVGNRLGFAFGQAFVLTLVVGALALLSKANRNASSLGKVLFWTQIVALLMVVAR